MQQLDHLLEDMMQTEAEGQIHFFPIGRFGRGYILNKPDQVGKIRTFFKRFYFFSIAVLVSAGAIFGVIAYAPAVLFLFFAYHVRLKKIIKKAKPVPDHQSLIQLYMHIMMHQSYLKLGLSILIPAGIAGLGTTALEEEPFLGICIMSIFSAGSTFYFLVLLARFRMLRNQKVQKQAAQTDEKAAATNEQTNESTDSSKTKSDGNPDQAAQENTDLNATDADADADADDDDDDDDAVVGGDDDSGAVLS